MFLVILELLIFIGISICFCKVIDKIILRNCTYDTKFCRDTRANLGRFAYKSEVEGTREWLNAHDKF